MRLLVIGGRGEPDTRAREVLRFVGFTSDTVSDLDEATQALDQVHYDVLLLDVEGLEGDALAWLRRVRSHRPELPMLVLSNRCAVADRVAYLDGGADDQMTRPVDLEEIAAHLRALVRRAGPRQAPVLTFGDLRFDPTSRTARTDQGLIHMTRREADLLELLIRRPGAVVRKSMIAEALYTLDETFTPNAIEAVMSRLRGRLATAGAEVTVQTVRGLGYVLTARHFAVP